MKFKEPPYLHHSWPKYADHTNKAVNLSLVTSIHIGRERYYPDNEGIPTLIFTFIPNNYTVWYLNSNEEAGKIYKELTK